MRFTLAFVLGSFSFGAPPERMPEDRWMARDKAYHFAVSAVIQGGGHALLRAQGWDYRDASLGAGAITLGAGLGKELWDRAHGRPFSWRDLVADGAGGAAAAAVVRQVDR